MEPVDKSLAAQALEMTNPYLEGKFAPIDSEIVAEDLDVIGELPADLEGMFVRNGSNPKYDPKGRYHWFDGDGMLHGVHIRDGKASYRNRYVRTKGLAREEKQQQALYTGILEPPDFSRGSPFKNSGNTDLVYHDGRLLALWWLGDKAHKIRLPDLETMGTFDFCGKLQRGMASHPKIDPRTGEMMIFDFFILPPYMYYGVVSAQGELIHQTPIELPGARLMHDIAITPKYTLLFDLPLYWDPEELIQGKARLTFDKNLPARIGVLPRYGDGDSIRWFETSSFFMYHTINAHEEGDEIVVLGCRIEDPVASSKANVENKPRLAYLKLDPYLTRWRLNLATGLVKEERLDDVASEFPRTNDSTLGTKQRYSYNPRIAPRTELLFDGLIKYDIETGQSKAYSYAPGTWGGEAAFAPRPNAQSEDDGYLISFSHDEANEKSELMVMDARDVEAGPVARIAIPQRVPIGYHTCWISAAELATQKND